MLPRREMNTVLGTTVATLISGTIGAMRGEAAVPQQDAQEHQHDAQEHASANAPRGVGNLIHESLGNLGESEGNMIMLTLRPKSVSTPHKHPGPVFAYVIAGRVENQVDPEEPKKYSAGDFWFEPALHVHRSLTNLSDTDEAKVLVFMVTPKDSPLGLPAK